jgi:hypothetical protein
MNRKRFTEADKDDMMARYQAGETPTSIAKSYQCYVQTIGKIRHERKIPSSQSSPRLTQAQKTIIADQYLQGLSSTTIGINIGKDPGTVLKELDRQDVARRPATLNKRKYKINENYFETIDNEEKAYFLGLLYADGNVASHIQDENGKWHKGNDVVLSLHEKDKDILEKYSAAIYGHIKLNKPCLLSSGQHSIAVSVYSKKFRENLIKLGCTPTKTFTIRFPTFLSDELTRHFIRGYFDGDGCISIKAVRMDITSNWYFVSALHDYINNVVGIKTLGVGKVGYGKEPDEITGSLQIHSTPNIIKFFNWLYKDCTVYMKRKYDYFMEFCAIQDAKKDKILAKTLDIENYGTYYIATYNGKQLTYDYINTLSPEQKEEAINEVFLFYRAGGFPYPVYSQNDLIGDFNNLKNADVSEFIKEKNIPIFNASGIYIFKHFAHHFYDTTSSLSKKPSMTKAFYDDDLLKRTIKNRMAGNNNSIHGNMIKQGLKNSRIAYRASIFFPIIAKAIYSAFCKEGDIIYDYSMGFGQRLTAALSLPFNIKYIGVDPYNQSYNSNIEIYKFLNKNIPLLNKDCEFICDGSENFCKEEYVGKVQLAFSSPPYFNLEIYNNGENQAYSNNQYGDFINIWWNKVVINSIKLLKEGGIFALNITEMVDRFPILNDMKAICIKNGLKEIDKFQIQLSRNDKFNNKNGILKYEPILIFQKQ